MAAWIVCALCALVILKPQEFIPALAGLPLLYIAFAAAAVLVVFDVCWRRVRPALAPQIPFALGFFAWALLTTAIKVPDVLSERVAFFVTAAGVVLAVGVGSASSRGLKAFAVTFLACGVLVTGVAIMQGRGPLMCMTAVDEEDWMGTGELRSDGRSCTLDDDCYKDAPNPEASYRCERQGPLGTSTVRGRVRYRGSLADPNELALMVGMTIPFAFALADRGRRRKRRDEGNEGGGSGGSGEDGAEATARSAGEDAVVGTAGTVHVAGVTDGAGVDGTHRGEEGRTADGLARKEAGVGQERPAWMAMRSEASGGAMMATAVPLPLLLTDKLLGRVGAGLRALPVVALLAAIAVMVVMTKSRTGVIVFLVVLGLYFIKRIGAWGVVLCCLVGPPMLLLGGRSGAEAEESSGERVELLREGFEMIRRTKGIGVGSGQFGYENSIGLTAHNAYLLAAAEVGIVGACLFGLTLYAAAKVPLAIWFGNYRVDSVVERFAPAVFVSLCGAFAGIFFLSWSYKDVLYMAIGASAALYGAAKGQDERVSVRISLTEVVLVCLGMMGILVAIYLGIRIFK
ncbi:O-antigen ligase family protein [Chondromyces apiculatus]|uniref:O-antigen ligase-related domain-containing protein n=1 Tax=Chondromyces apiculatus DSM 436 TaxID=1192034 RepID=A0A017T930_9BACT|nr:O-antigen ligase family protein [Chondromyces apiculatus]EYF05325.1 Hypothetical protein CAP_3466 [Chondromyces apiculatus DSM 436]